MEGRTITLKQLLENVPYPIDDLFCDPPLPGKNAAVPSRLFNSVDNCQFGADAAAGVVFYTAYNDRFDQAHQLMEILPAWLD